MLKVGGGGGGGKLIEVTEGINFLRLRTAFHTMKSSTRNSLGELPPMLLVREEELNGLDMQ